MRSGCLENRSSHPAVEMQVQYHDRACWTADASNFQMLHFVLVDA